MRNQRPKIWLCVMLCLPGLWSSASAQPRPPVRPNIVLIMMDDMSWGALSCYGNRYLKTAALDQLAAEGMRFTDAYVTPQCTPTRATLMTGQYTARNGLWHVLPGHYAPYARMTEPEYLKQLSRETFTLAKGLKSAGYATAAIGKWHLNTGADGNYNELKQAAAQHYGFDVVAPPASANEFNSGDKGVNRLTDEAWQFIEKHRRQPFFLYLAHHSIHNVVAAPDALVKKYLAQGYPAAGLHNATFLAALEHMDNAIGRLLEKLKEAQLREQTVVIFLTDNGGIQHQFDPAPFGKDSQGATPSRLTIREKLFDNAPLRYGKGSAYEGGIRVPLIVRWPGVIKPGSVDTTPVHAVDLMPTLLALGGAAVPPTHALDGQNLLPLLKQTGRLKPRALFWYMPLYDIRWAATPVAVIRQGDYKLLEFYGDYISPDDGRYEYRVGRRVELYNLRADIGEKHDLAERRPDKTRQMLRQLHAWHQAVGAELPQLNQDYQPAQALRETAGRLTRSR